MKHPGHVGCYFIGDPMHLHTLLSPMQHEKKRENNLHTINYKKEAKQKTRTDSNETTVTVNKCWTFHHFLQSSAGLCVRNMSVKQPKKKRNILILKTLIDYSMRGAKSAKRLACCKKKTRGGLFLVWSFFFLFDAQPTNESIPRTVSVIVRLI